MVGVHGDHRSVLECSIIVWVADGVHSLLDVSHESTGHYVLIVAVDLGHRYVHLLVEVGANRGANPLEAVTVVQINVTHVSPIGEVTNLFCSVAAEDLCDSRGAVGDRLLLVFVIYGLLGWHPFVVKWDAIVLRDAKDVIGGATVLVDWECLEAVWKSISTQFLLPLAEIGILDWWDSITLLPLS